MQASRPKVHACACMHVHVHVHSTLTKECYTRCPALRTGDGGYSPHKPSVQTHTLNRYEKPRLIYTVCKQSLGFRQCTCNSFQA